jgi:hypothetical protein
MKLHYLKLSWGKTPTRESGGVLCHGRAPFQPPAGQVSGSYERSTATCRESFPRWDGCRKAAICFPYEHRVASFGVALSGLISRMAQFYALDRRSFMLRRAPTDVDIEAFRCCPV